MLMGGISLVACKFLLSIYTVDSPVRVAVKNTYLLQNEWSHAECFRSLMLRTII